MDENNPMVKEVRRRNIENHKEHIEFLKMKLRKGKDTITAFNKPKEEPKPEEPESPEKEEDNNPETAS